MREQYKDSIKIMSDYSGFFSIRDNKINDYVACTDLEMLMASL